MRVVPKTISPKRGIAFSAVLLATLVALTAFGFVRGSTNHPLISKTETSNPATSTTMLFQGNSSATHLDAEHITLRSTGFEPSEITRPAGRFLLAVDNVTGMGEMSFRLLHHSGARLRDFPANGRFRLRQVVELPPGQYALVEVNHPNWACRITITAP
jgi:hypothetical protein